MPEIGEIARIVHYLKKHLAGHKITKVQVQPDEIVYGKVGTTAEQFQKAITGRTVLDARQQGKYFWLVMDSPPHPLMHFGMTGWVKFSNDDTSYYKPAKAEEQEWPPRFWKFVLHTDEGHECAFVDARRLARIRLVDAEAEEMRRTTPLKENGPDPVIDKDIVTFEWLAKKMRSKRVPIKAMLLDQAVLSGVGNWVADEVLYNARIHPEQYSNQFSDEEIKRLHYSLLEVTRIAVTALADSNQFPDTWLMKHRWSKGKKEGGKLPNGEKIIFLKVGGRTSAVVPSVQKKTGAVAADVKEESEDAKVKEEDDDTKGNEKSTGRIRKEVKTENTSVTNGLTTKRKGRNVAGSKESDVDEDEVMDEVKSKGRAIKKQKTADSKKPITVSKKATINSDKKETAGRRRSTRLSGA